jgi:thiol-disulfide isomerase/thioredoxin
MLPALLLLGVLAAFTPAALVVAPFLVALGRGASARALAAFALAFAAGFALAGFVGGGGYLRAIAVLALALLAFRLTADIQAPRAGIKLAPLLALCAGAGYAPYAGSALATLRAEPQPFLLGAGLFVYALGTAIALIALCALLARFAPRRMLEARALRVLHAVAALAAVVVIASQSADRLGPALARAQTTVAERAIMGAHDPGPPVPLAVFDRSGPWLNSPPLTRAALAGHAVLVDFWTYSCINCLRALPEVRAIAARYRDRGLIVIGVHSPEFAFEHDEARVRAATRELGVDYPVVLDNDYRIWGAFQNQFWPAQYLIDGEGRLRFRHYGEEGGAKIEAELRALLPDAGVGSAMGQAKANAKGIGLAASGSAERSPETYLGYARAERAQLGGVARHDAAARYDSGGVAALDDWGLDGEWRQGPQSLTLTAPGGRIVYRFVGRDLHLVLGPGREGRPLRFRVTLDGAAPGADHGEDTNAQGEGVITEYRLYQLIRQRQASGERRFAIEFLDGGVEAYAFTFG